MPLPQGKARDRDEGRRATGPGEVEKGMSHPGIRWPASGGAVRGIDDTFSAGGMTGAGAVSLSLPFSATRGGIPPVTLGYSTGGSAGAFGFGWTLNVPVMRRQTSRGVPRYQDDGSEPDVFVLGDGVELVPKLARQGANGPWVPVRRVTANHVIEEFIPRTLGGWDRIERWRTRATGRLHWRLISSDNVTSVFGSTPASCLADPADPDHRIFAWFLERVSDDRGNTMLLRYKPEDFAGLGRRIEAGRGPATTAALYLKHVLYGNRTPSVPGAAPPGDADFMFQTVFDFGEHDRDAPTPAEAVAWPVRPDPVSDRRAGFEIRTWRLCRRVLLFHRFAELPIDPCLVSSLDLIHDRVADDDAAPDSPPGPTCLRGAVQRGYVFDPASGSYRSEALPPIRYRYQAHRWDRTVRDLSMDGHGHGMGAVALGRHRWIDLDGEGAAGLLTHQSGAMRYARNLGGGRLAAERVEADLPVAAGQGDDPPRPELIDLDGSGVADLVRWEMAPRGFHQRRPEGGWSVWRGLNAFPAAAFEMPGATRLLDLTGDGVPDLVMTETDVMLWHRSRGLDGFDPARRVDLATDESEGPRLLFGDAAENVYLADMTGDGLSDLVRIRDAEVCYWANLGHGRFSNRIVMDGSPRFGRPGSFNPAMVRLVDVNGTGPADLLYFDGDGVQIWLNQQGNGYAPPRRIDTMPRVTEVTDLSVIDIMGSGTAAILWTSPLARDRGAPMRFIDLMGGVKPYLLTGVENGTGGETEIVYRSATEDYRADRAAGRDWITRPPFPVQVVAKVVRRDRIRGTRLTRAFRYAHGHFDTRDRAFRGFGRVEATDTEDFATFSRSGAANVAEAAHHQPPVRTVSWTHTGAWLPGGRLETAYASEWFDDGTGGAFALPHAALPAGLSRDEWLDAQRALMGAAVRSEVYSDDDSRQAGVPYSTVGSTHRVRLIQPAQGPHPAVFQVLDEVGLACAFERRRDDPRITETLTLERDERGLATRTATVVYGRRARPPGLPDPVWAAQVAGEVSVAEMDHTADTDSADAFRLRMVCETRGYDLLGVLVGAGRVDAQALAAAIAGAGRIPFEADPPGAGPALRLVGHTRRYFLRDDLTGDAPLGSTGARALPGRSHSLAMTAGLVAARYGPRVDAVMLAAAGYVHSEGDGDWWLPSAAPIHAADPVAEFFQPVGRRDPLGAQATLVRDAHKLMTVSSTDPLGNVTAHQIDYRRLGPAMTTDPSGNRVAAQVDALGAVSAITAMGKAGAGEGDTLANPTVRIERDRTAWIDRQAPVSARSFQREQHGAANPRFQEQVAYSDGSGAVIVVKAQADPGRALRISPVTGQIEEVTTNDRWIGNGRVIQDNKGAPIKAFEAYYSTTDAYETDAALVERGATAVNFYDPAGRPVRVLHADGTETRVNHDAWSIARFDANDTVRDSTWFAARGAPDPALEPEPADSERRAAWLAAAHHATPSVTHADVMGETVAEISDLGQSQTLATRTEHDRSGRWIRNFDETDRLVEEVFVDLLGRPLMSRHAERGERVSLTDAHGHGIRLWDGADRSFRVVHDAAGRITHQFARQGAGHELLLVRLVYGESHPQAAARNLRGRLMRIYDQAGETAVAQVDFMGRETDSSRRLMAQHGAGPVDWSAIAAITDPAALDAAVAPALSAERFVARQEFDAINRAIRAVLPDGSEILPTYGRDNGVAQIAVRLAGEANPRIILAGQSRNARGQRETTTLGNGLFARTDYDPLSYRPARMRLLPGAVAPDAQALQNLRLTYDPNGNLVELRDGAQATRYFDNAVVGADRRYAYDAVYRLIRAEGREHGAIAQPLDGVPEPVNQLPHPNDANSARRYAEIYLYDDLGNLRELRHVAAGAGGNWTRRYAYARDAAPADRTNRLTATSRPGDPAAGPFTAQYAHDARGNMTAMPHLATLEWNLLDQLVRLDLGGGGEALYAYGATGGRRRKSIRRLGGAREERLYLGGLEILRRFAPDGALRFERRTLHVGDDEGALATLDTKTVDTDNADPANPVGQPVIRYQFGDQLGSVVLECDAAGQPITYEEYHPFGSTAYRAVRPGGDISLKRYRFSGKERDDESGLHYFGARYYAAWLGRWISADPAGSVDGSNLFVFCSNNPATLRDAHGTDDEDPLNPAGQVTTTTYHEEKGFKFRGPRGGLKPNAELAAEFEKQAPKIFPDRPFKPGSVVVERIESRTDSKTGKTYKVPVFNAAWLDESGNELLPRKGQPGHVTTWNSKLESGDDIKEHVTPRAQERVLAGKDAAGNDIHTPQEDGRAPVVRVPKAVADEKTKGPDGDNAATEKLKKRLADKTQSNPTHHDVDMDSNGRAHRANERAGGPSKTGLRSGSINRGTLERMRQRFQQTPLGDVGNRIKQLTTSPKARAFGGVAVGLGGALAYETVPFLAETAVAVESAGVLAYQSGLATAVPLLEPVAAAAIAAPGAVGGIVLGSAAGGYLVGDAVEDWATEASGSRAMGVGAGTLAGAGTGAAVGAVIGSIVPGVGTAVGAGIGAVVGGIAGFIGSFW